VYRWRAQIQQTHWAKRKWRSYEPYAIARLGKVFVIRFTIDVDAPEEGPDVTFAKAGNIDMTESALVKGYRCEVVIVIEANEFREV
jgi:hypothetical protein